MSTEPPKSLETLIAGMLNLRVFVITWLPKGRDIRPRLQEHFEYMVGLERDGRLFASGPLGTAGDGSGMTIVRAASEADAASIAEGDPLVRHALRDYAVQVWTIMEGALSVNVAFSDRTMRLS